MGKEFTGELELASKGLFYEEFDGIIQVEPWGVKEERLFASRNLDYNLQIDRLISRLTNCPIDPTNLLLIDRQHIFIYMRCLSYGGDYSFNFKCEDCEEKVRYDMDLEKDLDVIYADDHSITTVLDSSEIKEPFYIKLPLSGVEIGWRLLRGKDEHAVKKYVRRSMKSAGDERQDYIYRTALRLVEVDGSNVDISSALQFVEGLKGKDSVTWRDHIKKISFGVEMEIEVKCRHCGYPNEMIMPLDKSFFRLS
jgi:hypothetical protein